MKSKALLTGAPARPFVGPWVELEAGKWVIEGGQSGVSVEVGQEILNLSGTPSVIKLEANALVRAILGDGLDTNDRISVMAAEVRDE